jgi:hypothetical protein
MCWTQRQQGLCICLFSHPKILGWAVWFDFQIFTRLTTPELRFLVGGVLTAMMPPAGSPCICGWRHFAAGNLVAATRLQCAGTLSDIRPFEL